MIGTEDNTIMDENTELINDVCIEILNKRISEEIYASRLYKSMALWFNVKGYDGFYKYWLNWSEEEKIHASWANNFLLDLGVKPNIVNGTKDIPSDFENVLDVINKTFDAEKDITKQCNELSALAIKENNFMLLDLGLKYNREQKEELNKITNIKAKITTFGLSEAVLFEMNEEFKED